MKLDLTDRDEKQLEKRGIKKEYLQWQLEMFEKGTSYVTLIRPCTVGDGIIRLSQKDAQRFAHIYEKEMSKLKKVKFVPASGAATRMFKAHMRFYNEGADLKRIKELLSQGDEDAQDIWLFMENIEKFAFYEDLESILNKRGLSIRELIKKGDINKLLHYLLKEDGLNYADTPKALIKFHCYPDGSRTAFEEHLVEATGYVRDEDGCYLHFTVSYEYKEKFIRFFEKIKDKYEKRFCSAYHIEFSLQNRSTDTIAVDLNNRPIRDRNGNLIFRPAGHGALLENLNSIDADVIFIKNIDNVLPDELKEYVYFWKKALAGYLLMTKAKINEFVHILNNKSVDEDTFQRIKKFCKNELYAEVPQNMDKDQQIRYMMDLLNRPLRVCGMVKNVKEPGGGPFWIKDSEGNVSLQIVEKAQVDMNSEDQKRIFNSSTHFNPVDIVCCIKDWKGNRFDLKRFRDINAVFITTKSKDGKEIKALELPGLWNGGMAYWNSIFIEVPSITFAPVKKVTDLLKDAHQTK